MKKLLQILTLFVLINTSLVIFSEKAVAQSVSFQVFYDDLSPYGSWYESPEYGYVWRPSLSGFTPYSTNGYWVLTDYGWTWVSDYSWGWAPFHYGRWYYDPLYGYVWVPGYEWGPGWVTWRRSDDYYGWAPIGPGVSISIAYSNGYNIPYNHWNFVSCNDFGRRDIHNYYIDRSKNVTIVNNTTVINTTKVDNTRRTTFNPGPDRTEVQRKVGRTINPVAIVDENKPAQRLTKNNVQLYRPVVENKDAAGKRPAPKKVIPRNEAKEQAVKAREEKNNEAASRRLKTVEAKPNVDRQPVDQQRTKQNNDRPVRQPQQQPEKKPVREEQPVPVKRPPVEQQEKTNAQPERQQPVRKQRDEQPQRTEHPQRNEQPQPQQRTDRPQRNEQPQPQQQPDRPRPTEQRPVQQQHEKQQRAMPQQNMDRPAPQQREQQPPRQAPPQRPPAPQKAPKG